MNHFLFKFLICATAFVGLVSNKAQAQLSSNPDKFLGNITTGWPGDMDTNGFIFSEYWNQVTHENGTKWGTVEGTRGKFNWGPADVAYNYAKEHGFPFKFHTFVMVELLAHGWLCARNMSPSLKSERRKGAYPTTYRACITLFSP